MAHRPLIGTYLDVLRTHLDFREDIDDVVAEVRDHLDSTFEGLVSRGVATHDAERATLDRFGSPDLVARALSRSPSGGLAVPTDFTVRAGTLAIYGGLLWISVIAAWWPAGALAPRGSVDRNITAVLWSIGWISLLAALALTLNTVSAMFTRHGGLGSLGRVGLALTALAFVAGMPAWVFQGWGLAVSVGLSLVALAVLGRGVAPRTPVIVLGGGAGVGVVVWLLLSARSESAIQFSGIWGETWVANLTSISVAAFLVAAGLFGVGSWLRSEQPVAFDLRGLVPSNPDGSVSM